MRRGGVRAAPVPPLSGAAQPRLVLTLGAPARASWRRRRCARAGPAARRRPLSAVVAAPAAPAHARRPPTAPPPRPPRACAAAAGGGEGGGAGGPRRAAPWRCRGHNAGQGGPVLTPRTDTAANPPARLPEVNENTFPAAGERQFAAMALACNGLPNLIISTH